MPRRDPMKVGKKWSDRLSAATQDMIDGVNAVTVAPSQLAVAHEDTFRQRLMEAINSGKWRDNLSAVTLQSWKTDMTTRGIPRAVEAARTALPATVAFLQQFLPFAAQVSDEIRAMPNATEADRNARMLANVARMRTFRRTGRI